MEISFDWGHKGESNVLVHDNGGSLRSHGGLVAPLGASYRLESGLGSSVVVSVGLFWRSHFVDVSQAGLVYRGSLLHISSSWVTNVGAIGTARCSDVFRGSSSPLSSLINLRITAVACGRIDGHQ